METLRLPSLPVKPSTSRETIPQPSKPSSKHTRTLGALLPSIGAITGYPDGIGGERQAPLPFPYLG